jgi:hypothetical protein
MSAMEFLRESGNEFDPTIARGVALEQILARIGKRHPHLAVQLGQDRATSWVRADELEADDAAHVRAALRELGAGGALEPRTRVASFVFGYAWRLAAPVATSFLLAPQVPRVHTGNVALRTDRGAAAAPLALLDPRLVATVAGDRPPPTGTVTLPDRARLLGFARSELDAHLDAVLGLHPLRLLGGKARRLLASDAAAAVFLTAGEALDRVAAAAESVVAFLAPPGTLHAPPNLVEVRRGGRSRVFRRRCACCLLYREGHVKCATCPLLPADEMRHRLADFV